MTIETSVTPVSGQTSRNVVGIATAAITIGTSAINEPNTNTSTMSAPAPATSTSISTLTLVVSPPPAPAARSASRPGHLDRRAADGDPVERLLGLARLRLTGLEPGPLRDVDERVRGPAILGDERRVGRERRARRAARPAPWRARRRARR